MSSLLLMVQDGYLIFMPPQAAVPLAFWGGLKAKAKDDGLDAELRADHSATRAKVHDSRRSIRWTVMDEMDEERTLYRRWVVRLYGEQDRWPWSGNWTPEMVSNYPVATLRVVQ
jgi:hypothetical protein